MLLNFCRSGFDPLMVLSKTTRRVPFMQPKLREEAFVTLWQNIRQKNLSATAAASPHKTNRPVWCADQKISESCYEGLLPASTGFHKLDVSPWQPAEQPEASYLQEEQLQKIIFTVPHSRLYVTMVHTVDQQLEQVGCMDTASGPHGHSQWQCGP